MLLVSVGVYHMARDNVHLYVANIPGTYHVWLHHQVRVFGVMDRNSE